MFKHFAKHEKSIMIVLAVALTVGFGVGGASTIKSFFAGVGRDTSGKWVAEVFGETYHEGEVYRQWSVLDLIGSTNRWTLAPIVYPTTRGQYRPQPLIDFPYYKAHLHMANEAGIEVTDEELAEQVKSFIRMYRIGVAQLTDMDYDVEAYYKQLLEDNNMERRTFEKALRDVLKVSKWYDMLAAGGVVSDDQVWLAYRNNLRRVSVRWVLVSPEDLAGKVEIPEDEKLLEWMKQQQGKVSMQSDLDSPARVTLGLLEMPIDEVIAKVKDPTSDEIEAYYNANKTTFLDFEKMKAKARAEWEKNNPDAEGDEPDWQSPRSYDEKDFLYKPVTDNEVRAEIIKQLLKFRARSEAVEKMIRIRKEIVDKLLENTGDEAPGSGFLKKFEGALDEWKGLPSYRTVGPLTREQLEAREDIGNAVRYNIELRRPGQEGIARTAFNFKAQDFAGSTVLFAATDDDGGVSRFIMLRRINTFERQPFKTMDADQLKAHLLKNRQLVEEAYRKQKADRQARELAERLEKALVVDDRIDWDHATKAEAKALAEYKIELQSVDNRMHPMVEQVVRDKDDTTEAPEAPKVLTDLQGHLYGGLLDDTEPIVQRAEAGWYVATIDKVTYPTPEQMEKDTKVTDMVRTQLARQAVMGRRGAYERYVQQNVKINQQLLEERNQPR